MNRADDKLTEALHREAEHFSAARGHDLTLDRVLSRAGEIRRGRRLRASVTMAAVVAAIAVPLGVTILGDSGPAHRPTPATTGPGDHSALALSALRHGPAPKNGYVVAGKLWPANLAFGTQNPPTQLARISGGYLIVRVDSQGGGVPTARFLADDGSRLSVTWPIQGGFAVSPQANVGAFVEPDGTVMAVQDAGSRYFEVGKIPPVPGSPALSVVAVTGDNCSGRSEADTCDIYVDSYGDTPRTWVLSPHTTPHPVQDLAQVTDVSSLGARAGYIDPTNSGPCSSVLNARGVEQWGGCDYQLRTFSPSGKHLLAAPAGSVGPGEGSMYVLDPRTGAPTLTLSAAAGASIMSTQWEDDSHVLVTLHEGQLSAVLRIGLDGSREYALPPVHSNDTAVPYLLATAN